MSRSTLRTLVAAVTVAAVIVSGCSLIPGLQAGTSSPPAPATPASKPASGTPSAKPAVSKTTSGTTVPVPGMPKKVTKISSDIDGIELRDLAAHGALVLDVRDAGDFKREHIDGSTNVPMAKFSGTVWPWSRDRSVVLVDRTGATSQGAQNWLARKGFSRVYHLFRGIEGYDDQLVGTDPQPIPPREPVLYYFTIDGAIDGVTIDSPVLEAADGFVEDLKKEFAGQFEYHEYDVSTVEGLSRFLEFDGTQLPMFRVVDEQGHSWQLTGSETFTGTRARLKKAIENYHDERD